MENRIAQMQEYTERAILIMNDSWSFKDMREYLDKAFKLCSPTEELAYYQIIATVMTKLYFQTKTLIGTNKVKKQYSLLFEYIDDKFSSIVQFNADIYNEDEAVVANSICCDIYNGLYRYYQAFYEPTLSAGSIWGLAGLGIAHATLKNFRKHIKSIAQNAATFLRKYKTNDEQILENIKTFANEK